MNPLRVRAKILKSSTSSDTGRDIICVDMKKIKKDTMYKFLLRKFRSFLRKCMDSYKMLKGFQDWTTERMNA